MVRNTLCSAVCAVLLAACQTQQALQPPEVAMASQYADDQSTEHKLLRWQDYLNDAALEKIIHQALQNNHDLQIASLRIAEAQAAYGIQRSTSFPTIGADAGGQRSRVPADLSYTGQVMHVDQYQAGIGLSQWELDLWGRIRSLNEAALQSFFASQWNQVAVRNSIILQVTQTYLTLSELEKRIHFAERSVQNYQNSVRIFKRRYEVGSGSKVEYVQAETLLRNGQALLAQLNQAKATTANFLVQLVGEPIEVPVPSLDRVVFKTTSIQTGLPSDLLLNRPDIRAVEAKLQAENANIYAARAAFFPRIALTGSYGTASADLDGLFKSGSAAWSFAPSISIPIFTAGRLKNQVKLAEVRTDIAVAEYEKTVQKAFREVSDALAQRRWLSEQLHIQQQGLDALNERARLAELRYDNGAVNYLEVLDAQRSLLQAEQQWIETQSALLKSYVQLYVALGGDSQQYQTQQSSSL
ncbi:RND transporter [Acinetobacter larvae]|uniref:RND transporter n=1 Tax=Acinetobacter larvae TaxID=1789224 RepID=A0A1B2M494_9GAMM|nr:RND transporter [Acinetobacter larvae]